ncbi:MAG: hypothetical protein BGO54_12545 [Sphingobacteriales bacterium 46-32]|nr:MAG: hypothetical protein BGO54_12545 [Sphingobacteriales bacterium 46-32]
MVNNLLFSMKKISAEQIELAYAVSKAVYNREISRNEGLDRLRETAMNKGTASIYFGVYAYLITGRTFSRTVSAQSFDYYLSQIYLENGSEQLLTSLMALKNHIQYFELIQNVTMKLVRDIYVKYSFLYSENKPEEINVSSDDDAICFPEGKEIYKLHLMKERNSELVRLAKKRYLERDALLSCQICSFSFVSNYGELGRGFIEAHHIYPISELKSETETKIDDLILVCSNCHRMLHRNRPWTTIENLKEIKRKFI